MAKRILIIDDEAPMIMYLRTLLEDHGYETITSSNAEEALLKIRDQAPDLISLDLLMPDKTGISLYRELKKDKQLSRIPVIMVTGFTAEQHPMIDFKQFIYRRGIPGPEAFIEKPIDPEELLSAVTKVLEGSASSSL